MTKWVERLGCQKNGLSGPTRVARSNLRLNLSQICNRSFVIGGSDNVWSLRAGQTQGSARRLSGRRSSGGSHGENFGQFIKRGRKFP